MKIRTPKPKTPHSNGYSPVTLYDTIVMRLFAHQGDGDMVEQLMEEMYSMYLDHNKHQGLLPSTDFFSLVLFAWSRSKDPGAAERALELFDRILELEAEQELPGLEVTARIYNIVLVCFCNGV